MNEHLGYAFFQQSIKIRTTTTKRFVRRFLHTEVDSTRAALFEHFLSSALPWEK